MMVQLYLILPLVRGYVSKIGTPDFVRRRGSEILLQKIFKNLVDSPFAVTRLVPAGHRKQTKLRIHVLVAGSSADTDALVFQQSRH